MLTNNSTLINVKGGLNASLIMLYQILFFECGVIMINKEK